MVEIVPAILATSEDEFRTKVENVRHLGLRVQIDVIDGKFVDNKTWAPPGEIDKILGDIPFEVHLMIRDPEHATPVWMAAGAKYVYVHAEATEKELLIERAMGKHEGVLGIAINPDTPIARIVPDLQKLKAVLVMGVNPGWSGQAFQEIAIEKVASIRKIAPGITIAVDGGVNPQNAPLLAAAGANVLVAGSSLTDSWDSRGAYEQFRNALKDFMV